MGILCFEFLVGSPPFDEEDQQQTYQRIRDVDLRFPSYISDEAKDLISKLLIKQPNGRLSLDEVLRHPFIRKYNPDLADLDPNSDF